MTGMRLFDERGAVRLNMTSRISKSVGKVVTGQRDGSLPISMAEGGEPFYLVIPLASMGRTGRKPTITMTRTTLSWSYDFDREFPGAYPANCEIHYGYN